MVGTVASIVPDISATDGHGTEKAVADTGTAVNERLQAIASSGREYGVAIQSRLSQSLERQPLLLGAIGLAIGAGIASTFATTEVETEWMGEQGAAAREKLQGAVAEGKERARKVVVRCSGRGGSAGTDARRCERMPRSRSPKKSAMSQALRGNRWRGLSGRRPKPLRSPLRAVLQRMWRILVDIAVIN